MRFGLPKQRSLDEGTHILKTARAQKTTSSWKNSWKLLLALGLSLLAPLRAQANCVTAFRELLSSAQKLAPQSPKRPLKQIQELRLGTYNAYNLMQSADGQVMKAEHHRQGIASVILDNNLDVVVLQEVENEAALKAFTEQYLNDLYEPLISHGNDARGIQVAYLIKKDLPFQIELLSHAKSMAVDPVSGATKPIFSRDLPALKIWSEGQNPSREDPILILFGTHFKSKRNRPGDIQSRLLRGTQVRAASEIIENEMKAHPSSFVMIAGDFNGDVRLEAEFDPLKRFLKDAFELQPHVPNDMDRVTHTYHPRDGATQFSQIDAFFVKNSEPSLIKETFVYRYKDASGNTKPIPRSYDERRENPSDHFPVILKFNFEKLLQDRNIQSNIYKSNIYKLVPQFPCELTA